MPFTFLAHQAAVLPLKLWRPRWFSGTALVLGSMAPDVEYFLRGRPLGTIGHTLVGQVVFCLPLTVVLVLLVRGVIAAPLARELPDVGPFHLRDLRVIDGLPSSVVAWTRVVTSALVGSFSHVAWDGFTHSDGWAVERLSVLRAPLFVLAGHEIRAYKALQHGSTVAGAVATLAMLYLIGRDRRLLRWAGATGPEPPPSRSNRVMLLSAAVVSAVLGAAVAILDTRAGGGGVLAIAVSVFLRATAFGFAGLCLGCVLVRRREEATKKAPEGAW